jgi:hypothetical protein
MVGGTYMCANLHVTQLMMCILIWHAIVVLFQGEFDADIYKHNYIDIIYRANCIVLDRSLAAYVLVCTYIYTNKEAYC